MLISIVEPSQAVRIRQMYHLAVIGGTQSDNFESPEEKDQRDGLDGCESLTLLQNHLSRICSARVPDSLEILGGFLILTSITQFPRAVGFVGFTQPACMVVAKVSFNDMRNKDLYVKEASSPGVF